VHVSVLENGEFIIKCIQTNPIKCGPENVTEDESTQNEENKEFR